ncbi:MAG: DUF3006 domain-containing protein [Defluviitaleaceae bacterium]|nr:DUF3006 domain-containing protein [Defluviitaleaceae bacterium]
MDKQSISLEEITRPAPKWVIDRIEEGWAVLESDIHEIMSLPVNQLPKDAKPGSTLIRVESKWYVNEADTAARVSRIKEKFARLKK